MFSAPDWTYEPKWDGFRVLATVRNGYVRLVS
jgi:ATP-dependent DNA ligase